MNALIRLAAGFALAAAAVVPVTSPAFAQNAQQQSAWVKICTQDQNTQKELCLITQELRTNQGQFLASLAIREVPGEARKSMLISVPVGMVIKPGVNLQIDGSQPEKVDYTICFPNACYAERVIDEAFINRMKRGGKIQMITYNQAGKQVRFDMTLIGFTATYDGEGIDPAALQAQQATLQQELDRRAQEARDRLVAEQRKAIEGSTSNN